MSEFVSATTDADFESDVIESSIPVLVDFWAEWCGPCKMIAPVLDEVAQEFDGKLKVVKVNVDDNSQTPEQYGVRGIPTLIMFKGGSQVDMKVGALTKSQLVEFINQHTD